MMMEGEKEGRKRKEGRKGRKEVDGRPREQEEEEEEEVVCPFPGFSAPRNKSEFTLPKC